MNPALGRYSRCNPLSLQCMKVDLKVMDFAGGQLYVLARLQSPVVRSTLVETSLTLTEEPQANVHRYEHLRNQMQEVTHVK